jgi:hypothetical protein
LGPRGRRFESCLPDHVFSQKGTDAPREQADVFGGGPKQRRGGGIGRRNRLKICREFLPYRFESGPRHQYTPCGCSSVVEPQPSKLVAWVRFPSPAPYAMQNRRTCIVRLFFVCGGERLAATALCLNLSKNVRWLRVVETYVFV